MPSSERTAPVRDLTLISGQPLLVPAATSVEALREAETRISEIQTRLIQQGRL
jgi:hypothetical protein